MEWNLSSTQQTKDRDIAKTPNQNAGPKSTAQRIEHIYEGRDNGKALAEINGIDIRITMQCSTENADLNHLIERR